MAIQWMTGERTRFDRIVFSRPPPRSVTVGQKLAMFEVQAEPGIEQEVEVVLLGGGSGQLGGTTVKNFISNEPHPSLCFFDDITITPRKERAACLPFGLMPPFFFCACRSVTIANNHTPRHRCCSGQLCLGSPKCGLSGHGVCPRCPPHCRGAPAQAAVGNGGAVCRLRANAALLMRHCRVSEGG